MPGFFFASSGEFIFFAPPKKTNQKKGGPGGCTNGTENNSPRSRGRSRASQGFWDRVSPLVRAGRGIFPACELGERPKAREAQGTLIGVRQSGQAVGRPSLWVLSLGRARESTSPEGAKPTNQKELTSRPKRAKQNTLMESRLQAAPANHHPTRRNATLRCEGKI